MAKDRKKLLHIHSSVPDKQPTAASLEVGEIAVNNAKDQEFLSLKNSDNKVVRFSSDEQIVSIMEKKEVLPYKGYVRGETGPSSTSGDTPTADTYGSYGITNNDLLTNKSNIVIKLNQVVASNTIKHDKVNGSKDKYNKDVNPTNDGGLTDGAGFFIDMSRYAMQDANPQFSSTTNTCRTTLSGTTIIRGLDDSCGSLLDAKVAAEVGDFGTATNKIGTATTTISADTTLTVSGTTTETHNGVVTITNNNNKTETTTGVNTVNNKNNYNINTSGNTNILTTGNNVIHSDGKVGISAKGELLLVSSEEDIIITADDNICETAGIKATFYGVNQTNVGLDCDDTSASTTTNVYGKTLNVYASTANTSATTVNNNTTTFNITGDTNITGDLTINGEICPTSGLCKTLSWTYGDVKTNGGSAVNSSTNFKEDKAFVIPRCVGDMNRSKFGYSYGDVHSKYGDTGGTYDPGEACANQTTDTVTIPTSIGHLNEWSQNCFTIDNNLCVTGNITATGSVFSTSDERKKENINFIDADSKLKVRNIPLKSFNFKEDLTKRKVYGVIAQEVEEAGLDELVHTDEGGVKSVDYTSFLILRIAYLEKMIGHMHSKIVQLEGQINEK
jgi:hypothetical protein